MKTWKLKRRWVLIIHRCFGRPPHLKMCCLQIAGGDCSSPLLRKKHKHRKRFNVQRHNNKKHIHYNNSAFLILASLKTLFFAPQQSKSFGFAYYILANQEQQHVMTARTRTQKKRKVGDVKLNRSSNLCVNTDLVLQDINTDLTCCTVYKLKASGKQDYTLHTHSDDEGSSRILIDLTSVRQTQGGFLKNSDMKQWNSERNKSNKRWQERTKKKRERDWKWG